MNEEKTTTWQWRQGYDYATAKYKTEIDRLRTENAELKDALLEYGHHRAGCLWVRDVDDMCDCGWREIARQRRGNE